MDVALLDLKLRFSIGFIMEALVKCLKSKFLVRISLLSCSLKSIQSYRNFKLKKDRPQPVSPVLRSRRKGDQRYKSKFDSNLMNEDSSLKNR